MSTPSPSQTVVPGAAATTRTTTRTTRTTTTSAATPAAPAGTSTTTAQQDVSNAFEDAVGEEVGLFTDIEKFIEELESGQKLSQESVIGVVVLAVIILMFIISIVVAGVYTSRFNESLADGELPHGETLKTTSDLMAVSWLFVGVPVVNVGLASGFASMYDTTKRRMRRAAARGGV